MTYEAFETIRIDVEGALAVVTVAREAALNALSSKVISELTMASGELEVSGEIRAVIVTGEGDKAFVAGADIAEMRDLTPTQAHAFAEMGGALAHSIETSEKPWIAAVNGFALGGGCELAMMCDFIIAADTAKFGQPEITLGTIPGIGGTQRLTRAVGKSKAMDLCLTGRMMDAAEAERSGLVSRIVPADKLMDEVMAAAEKIASMSRPAVAMAKEAVNRAFETTLAEGMSVERNLFHSTFALEDRSEGMAAFIEKRKPVNKNR